MGPLYFLPYSASYPSAGSDYKNKVSGTWANYKKNFIDAYTTGLVHNPQLPDDPATVGFDETQGATSEGQGYGLLLALYNNDQIYFDKILTAVYAKMHDNSSSGKGLFASVVDINGNLNNSSYASATDGDTFITLALIFADILVQKGYWSDTSNNYDSKAQDLIDNIYANDVDNGKYLMPGDGWSSKDAANPSYFFTAALKTFKNYQKNFHDWDPVVDQCYMTLQAVNPDGYDGYLYGLSPDLCTRAGGISQYGTTGPSYPSDNGYHMWYDGIRTPWMMALDAIWFKDPRAVQYCQNGMTFLAGTDTDDNSAAQSAASNAILYDMNGTPYTNGDGAWHSEMTAGMWGTGAMGSGRPNTKSAFNAEFENNFSQYATAATGGYWGNGNWSGEGSEYYNQSLASFAALLMSGNLVNVYNDLMVPPDTTPPTDPIVTDDGANTASPSQLHATWSSSDPESGIAEYQYSISTDPTDPDTGNIVPWTSVQTDTQVTKTGLSLTNGTTYYFHVKAKNGAGLWSNVVSSDGITTNFDLTPPTDPVVTDDGATTSSATQLHASWSSSDPDSGIAEYQYSISTDPTDPDTGNIVPWTSTGTDAQVTATGLTLTNGTTYYFHVKAKNGSDLWSNVGHSDGITANNITTPLYYLCYSANYPTAGSDYKDKIGGTWANYKTNFIDAYASGLVHNPQLGDNGSPDTEGSTSEAQGYGLLLAIYNSDQTYFDKILTAAYAKMHDKDGKGLFASTVDMSGDNVLDATSTTDGDIFITLALIFADTLIKQGCWSDTGNDYGSKAQNLIDNIYANDVDGGQYLMPGDGWTGKDAANPSYFFTAALKTFQFYQANFHDWKPVVDQCYTTLQSTDGYSNGLTPDMCTRAGGISQYGHTGPAGASDNGYHMWYDGIRGPWMMTLDKIWFNDKRADEYLQNGRIFLTCSYGDETTAASKAILYDMNGTPYGDGDGAFHNELTEGMWATGAMVSGSPVYQSAFNTEFENNFSQNATAANGGYWGNWPGVGKYYYNQSLASFAALLLSGNFVNVYKDVVMMADTTPPSDPAVTDDGVYTLSLSQLHATWSPSIDKESGVIEYQYSISTDPTDPTIGNIVPWTTADTNTEITASNLNLTNGQTYYFHVKAKNGAGLWSNVANSDGIMVDDTPPTDPIVNDDGKYATSLSQLHVTYSSSDPESGVTEYQYSISTDPTDPDTGNILPWTPAGTDTDITASNLNLTNGQTYYFHIKALDGAGQWSNVGSSDGITVDTTPPTDPVVIDDGVSTGSLSQLHASWSSSDPESGVTEYQYSISTDPTDPDTGNIVPWTPVQTDTQVTRTGLSLTNGTTYYFHVKAKDGAGLVSNIGSSDGITVAVDTTPPTDPIVYDDGIYTNYSTQLHASWSSSDPDSGITEYQYSISTDPTDPENGKIVDWTSVQTDTQVTKTGLSLTNGTTYYFHVKAKNGANMWSNVGNSDGITVNDTVGSLYFLCYSADYPTAGSDYKDKIGGTWANYKTNFIDAYTSGLVHNPQLGNNGSPDTEGSTSEAQGYGLLLAIYNSDQTYFDKILTAAYAKMHNKDGKGLFAATVDKSGDNVLDATSATDGDIFITLALIFADTLVKHGCWSDTDNNYSGKAQDLINNIYANDVDNVGLKKYLMPGDGWVSKDAANPSYFFTAALKTFQYYQATFHDWKTVVDQCFTTLQSSQGYSNGLSPDLMDTKTGGISQYGTTGPLSNGADMWNDAIRTPWMMAVDAIWFNDPRAVQYCTNGKNNLTGRYGSEAAAAANSILYKMDGTPYTSNEGAWHSEITAGMWATGAMVSGSPVYKSAFNTEFENNFSQYATAANGGYWGNTSETGVANLYYNQSLASFAALLLSGNFVNVYKDLVKSPDTTPPTDPAVTDDGVYTIISSELHAALSPASDPDSEIKEYQYSISTDPLDPDTGNVVEWTPLGPNTTDINATNLNLTNGKTYYFHVKAINGEGLASHIVHSDGIKVDTTLPSQPNVTDDGKYTTSSDLHATWSSSDDESGVTGYWYAVSTDPDDPKIGDPENIVPWTSAGTDTEITLSDLNLEEGKTYYFHVISKNGAGQFSVPGHSDGITVDITPPTKPVVNGMVQKSGPTATLKGAWSSSDPESGVTEYMYSISTDPNDPDIGNLVTWTSAGTNTQVTLDNLSLSGTKSYYFHVKAKDGAGMWSEVGSSDGLQIGIVDTTPPSDPAVTDSGEYTSSSTELDATLSPSFDNESGITGYEYAISTDPNDPMIGMAENALPWTSVGPDATKITAKGLDLANGKTYYFHVRAVNGVGKMSDIVHSDGITVDTTPPTTPVVTDDGTYTTSLSEFHAAWSSSDPESGVTEYIYTISTDPTDPENGKIINWTSAGTNTDVTVTGLSLTEGVTYYFHVEAKDGAGLWSLAGHSDGIIAGYPTTKLNSIYPNPFTGNLNIVYNLESTSDVTITICNALGNVVWTQNQKNQQAGVYSQTWDGSGAAAGMYSIIVLAGSKVILRKKAIKNN